ncbi:epoxide hydrolase family protein [uncultured Jatrophihabitans sp.]|uniref:epoxide hydrolase family protein n=1 Tax=uncultured Jatrophihabitans sp. TaxID=1610747 RepID=UPI0035CAE0BF
MTEPSTDTAVPPMFSVPDAQLEDLHRRLASTKWPARWPDRRPGDWTAGAPADEVSRLTDRWQHGYDWRRVERELNALPWGHVDLDGASISYLHFRAEDADALPIALTNGWPSSFAELVGLARALSQPAAGTEDNRPGFHVVVPCLPGFPGSDQSPAFPAAVPTHELWHRLMSKHLGYRRYGAHGGDLGAGTTSLLGQHHPEHVVGIHLTSVADPAAYDTSTLTADERAYLADAARWVRDEGAYEHQQMTRPETLSYGLSDSPVGLLAWIVEKYFAWSDNDGTLASVFTDDDILTQASLYWFTNCIATSFRPYFEHAQGHAPRVDRVEVPTAVAVFPKDLTRPPRSWVERTYRVERYTVMPRGGHFAAHEVPDLLARDLAAFFAGRS